MTNPKVLIVDDEAVLRDTLERTFRRDSYELHFAKNGREGLEKIRDVLPDVILLDLAMPEMSGLEMLQELDIQPNAPYSVIILTGHGGDEDLRQCYKLGVHSFLRKPVNPVEVRGQVRQSLELRKYQRELHDLLEQRTEELWKTEKRRRQEEIRLDILQKTGSDFGEVRERTAALELTLERLISQTEFEQVAMYGIGEVAFFDEAPTLELQAHFPKKKKPFQFPESLSSESGIIAVALNEKRVVFVPNTSENPQKALTPETPGMLALLAIPIIEFDEPVGLFLAVGKAGKVNFDLRDTVFVGAVARMGMMAAKNAHNLDIIRLQVQTLEERVHERTETIRELMNHTGQGILTFGTDYRVHDEVSSPCLRFFGRSIAGENVLELLFAASGTESQSDDSTGEKPADIQAIQELMDLIFAGQGSFDLFEAFFPKEILRNDFILSVQYRLIPATKSRGAKMMILIDDITRERRLTTQILQEKAQHHMILRVALDRDGFLEFLRELDDLFEALDAQLARVGPASPQEVDINELFRSYHTIKGGSSSYGLSKLADYIHTLESEFEALRKGEESMKRKTMKTLNKKTAEMRELLKSSLETLHGTALEDEIKQHEITYRISESRLPAFKDGLLPDLLDTVCENLYQELPIEFTPEKKAELCEILQSDLGRDLENALDYLRKQPLAPVLRKYATLARDLGERLGKPVEVSLEGEHLEVIHAPLSHLFSVLVHLIRNAVDHGLDTPEERLMLRKPEIGQLKLKASLDASIFSFSIEDDGKGIDPEVIKNTALEKGLLSAKEAATFSENELQSLIFRPGFSTKQDVSSISGRGVGMDAVKAVVREMGGTLNLHSKHGEGTTFEIHIPHGVDG